MLRVTQQTNPQQAKRYYSAADYYAEGQEVVSAWGGHGAEHLGLGGRVDKAAFDRLCDNLDPRTGGVAGVESSKPRTTAESEPPTSAISHRRPVILGPNG